MLTWHDPSEYLYPIRTIGGQHRALTHIALFTERRHVFVKAYPAEAPRGLINDIVGYLMARHAGIDQPPGGIIALPAQALARAGITTTEPAIWCFTSTSCIDLNDRRHGSLAALFGSNLESVRTILEGWPGFAQLVAFDTWLANVDRNTGNLMLTGANTLCPIDHSDILTGPAWQFDELVANEDQWTMNKLIDIIWPIDTLPLPIRSAILNSAERFQKVYASAREDLHHWLSSSDNTLHRGHHFIWKRSESCKDILANKLSMIL